MRKWFIIKEEPKITLLYWIQGKQYESNHCRSPWKAIPAWNLVLIHMWALKVKLNVLFLCFVDEWSCRIPVKAWARDLLVSDAGARPGKALGKVSLIDMCTYCAILERTEILKVIACSILYAKMKISSSQSLNYCTHGTTLQR